MVYGIFHALNSICPFSFLPPSHLSLSTTQMLIYTWYFLQWNGFCPNLHSPDTLYRLGPGESPWESVWHRIMSSERKQVSNVLLGEWKHHQTKRVDLKNLNCLEWMFIWKGSEHLRIKDRHWKLIPRPTYYWLKKQENCELAGPLLRCALTTQVVQTSRFCLLTLGPSSADLRNLPDSRRCPYFSSFVFKNVNMNYNSFYY